MKSFLCPCGLPDAEHRTFPTVPPVGTEVWCGACDVVWVLKPEGWTDGGALAAEVITPERRSTITRALIALQADERELTRRWLS